MIGCHGEPSQFVVLSAPIDVPGRSHHRRALRAGRPAHEGNRRGFRAKPVKPLASRMNGARSVHPAATARFLRLVSARSSDLVIVRQPDRDADEDMATNVEALLFEGGRPVLFLPPNGQLASPIKPDPDRLGRLPRGRPGHPRRAAVAQGRRSAVEVVVDGSRQATRYRYAPLAGTDIAGCLSRHDIHVNVTTVSKGSGSTARGDFGPGCRQQCRSRGDGRLYPPAAEGMAVWRRDPGIHGEARRYRC
jgi:hypothetical protein